MRPIDRALYTAVLEGNLQEASGLFIPDSRYCNAVPDVNAKLVNPDNPEEFHTILGTAVNRGSAEMVRFLVDKDADVNAKDGDGTSPLFVAACKGFTEIAEKLIAAGADVNADPPPLTAATGLSGSIGIVRLLITNGADININNGCSLFFAAERGDTEIAEYLLANGADINARCEGSTPLEIAERKGHTAIVRLLRERAATASQQPPQPKPVPLPPPLPERLFYICDNTGTRQGSPISREQLQTLANQGRISPQTPLEDAAGRQGMPGQLGISFPQIANWYYYDNAATKQGPFTDEQIEELIEQRVIVPQTRLETEAGYQGFAAQVARFKQRFDSLPPVNTSDLYGFKEYIGYKPIIVFIAGTVGVGIAGSVIGWWLLLLWIIAAGAFFGIKYREYANLPDELKNLLKDVVTPEVKKVRLGTYHFEQGERYHSQGNLENAIKSYSEAIKYGHEEARVKLGMCYYEQGRNYHSQGNLESAIKSYDKAIEYGHEEARTAKTEIVDSYYEQGRDCHSRGDLENAIIYYDKAMKYGHEEARIKLGTCYYQQGENYHSQGSFENAIKSYDKAIEYGHEKAKEALASCRVAKEKARVLKYIEEAERNFADFTNLDINGYRYRNRYYEDAIKLIRKAINLYIKIEGLDSPNAGRLLPTLKRVYRDYGDLLRSQGRHDSARHMYEQSR